MWADFHCEVRILDPLAFIDQNIYLSVYLLPFFFQADKAALDDVIGLTDSSAVLIPERDKGGTEREHEEEEDIEGNRMGVGKNTTSKTMDSSSEGGKYEEESKHGADFYPIPVRECIFIGLPFYCYKMWL